MTEGKHKTAKDVIMNIHNDRYLELMHAECDLKALHAEVERVLADAADASRNDRVSPDAGKVDWSTSPHKAFYHGRDKAITYIRKHLTAALDTQEDIMAKQTQDEKDFELRMKGGKYDKLRASVTGVRDAISVAVAISPGDDATLNMGKVKCFRNDLAAALSAAPAGEPGNPPLEGAFTDLTLCTGITHDVEPDCCGFWCLRYDADKCEAWVECNECAQRVYLMGPNKQPGQPMNAASGAGEPATCDGRLYALRARVTRSADFVMATHKDGRIDLDVATLIRDMLLSHLAAVEDDVMGGYVDIVFDGPPSHESGRFVEVEDNKGAGISYGDWVERADGYWVLRIPRIQRTPRPGIDREKVREIVDELRDDNNDLRQKAPWRVSHLCDRLEALLDGAAPAGEMTGQFEVGKDHMKPGEPRYRYPIKLDPYPGPGDIYIVDGDGTYYGAIKEITDAFGKPLKIEYYEKEKAAPAGEPVSPDVVAKAFHEAYERLAPEHQYKTRKESAVAWDNVPFRNKELMIAVATEIIGKFGLATKPPAPTGIDREKVEVILDKMREDNADFLHPFISDLAVLLKDTPDHMPDARKMVGIDPAQVRALRDAYLLRSGVNVSWRGRDYVDLYNALTRIETSLLDGAAPSEPTTLKRFTTEIARLAKEMATTNFDNCSQNDRTGHKQRWARVLTQIANDPDYNAPQEPASSTECSECRCELPRNEAWPVCKACLDKLPREPMVPKQFLVNSQGKVERQRENINELVKKYKGAKGTIATLNHQIQGFQERILNAINKPQEPMVPMAVMDEALDSSPYVTSGFHTNGKRILYVQKRAIKKALLPYRPAPVPRVEGVQRADVAQKRKMQGSQLPKADELEPEQIYLDKGDVECTHCEGRGYFHMHPDEGDGSGEERCTHCDGKGYHTAEEIAEDEADAPEEPYHRVEDGGE